MKKPLVLFKTLKLKVSFSISVFIILLQFETGRETQGVQLDCFTLLDKLPSTSTTIDLGICYYFVPQLSSVVVFYLCVFVMVGSLCDCKVYADVTVVSSCSVVIMTLVADI